MTEEITQFISAEEIAQKVEDLAKELSAKFSGKAVTIVSVLTGGIVFAVDLIRKLDLEVELDFIDLSSYNSGTTSCGKITINMDIKHDISGKDVIIIEDIIDTGCTLSFLIDYLSKKSPNSITLCTLLDKPSRRSVEVTADYSLFTIPDEFVVGYGLDYAQRYRNLPYIGILSFKN